MRQVFDRGEFNALFVDMDAPTNDDVSITTDGRRLDSVEAVLDLVEEAERERATAERVTVVDANARPNPRPEYCWRVQQRPTDALRSRGIHLVGFTCRPELCRVTWCRLVLQRIARHQRDRDRLLTRKLGFPLPRSSGSTSSGARPWLRRACVRPHDGAYAGDPITSP